MEKKTVRVEILDRQINQLSWLACHVTDIFLPDRFMSVFIWLTQIHGRTSCYPPKIKTWVAAGVGQLFMRTCQYFSSASLAASVIESCPPGPKQTLHFTNCVVLIFQLHSMHVPNHIANFGIKWQGNSIFNDFVLLWPNLLKSLTLISKATLFNTHFHIVHVFHSAISCTAISEEENRIMNFRFCSFIHSFIRSMANRCRSTRNKR